MAAISLARWRGTGGWRDAFTPDVDLPGVWGCIDLRPDPTAVDGFCLVANADGSDLTGKASSLLKLGALDLNDTDTIGPVIRRMLGNRLNIDLTSDATMRDLIRAILLREARTDGSRWAPLQAAGNRFEVWIANQLIDTVPYVAGGAVGYEDFSGSDGSSIGNLQTWTEVTGNAQRVSGKVRCTSTGSIDGCRCELDLGTADMYAKVSVATLTSVANYNYVATRARYAAAADTHYHFEVGFAGATNDTALYYWISGFSTVIAGDIVTAHPARPFNIICGAQGSSIKAWKNTDRSAAPFFSATDTHITTGSRGGLMVYNDDGVTTAEADDFEVGTLGGGSLPPMRAARRAILAR